MNIRKLIFPGPIFKTLVWLAWLYCHSGHSGLVFQLLLINNPQQTDQQDTCPPRPAARPRLFLCLLDPPPTPCRLMGIIDCFSLMRKLLVTVMKL
jgi:hypothetical protein